MKCPCCGKEHHYFLEYFVSSVTSPKKLAKLAGSPDWWVRLQVVHNLLTPEWVVHLLTADTDPLVKKAAYLRLGGILTTQAGEPSG